MKVCDCCGVTDKKCEIIVKVYGHDFCENCNEKVIDFVLKLVKEKQ